MFDSQVAVVTGATSGIGLAIAVALAEHGAEVHALGRNIDALTSTREALQKRGACLVPRHVDLFNESDVRAFAASLPRVHILAHCAGMIRRTSFLDAHVEDFDAMYQLHLRTPFLLTQLFLPSLIQHQGQVVFVHTSGDRPFGAYKSHYSATKHGLVALAECLREEVKTDGVRVLNIFLGRVATPMQEAVCRAEGKPYEPEKLIQPETIADTVVHALSVPASAEVASINIRTRS
jgi:NAD(P)-dependent dehydrogenase (short-subunit alcohol dehydrogenase family)